MPPEVMAFSFTGDAVFVMDDEPSLPVGIPLDGEVGFWFSVDMNAATKGSYAGHLQVTTFEGQVEVALEGVVSVE